MLGKSKFVCLLMRFIVLEILSNCIAKDPRKANFFLQGDLFERGFVLNGDADGEPGDRLPLDRVPGSGRTVHNA